MSENLTLEDLLVLAGGLRPDAYKVEGVIARTEADGNRLAAPDRTYPTFVVPIQSGYVATPQDKKTPLKAFDRITVRNVLGWEPLDVVLIQGEVLYPGNYSMATKDETISSLIKKAGGLRKEALPEGAMVKRNRNILNLAPDTPAPTYEITINLAQALKNPKGAEDIVLKDGDQIFIPTNPGTIEVKGAVKRALTLQYRSTYIRLVVQNLWYNIPVFGTRKDVNEFDYQKFNPETTKSSARGDTSTNRRTHLSLPGI